MCVVLVLVAVRFGLWTMMAELLCFSVDDFVVFFRSIALLVLISPPHQVRTAAHTASEYDSYLHRRCWTAAASKGLFCLVCIVLVLVAVRFASWTMMADLLCFSVDDFVVFCFRSIALLVLISPPHQVRTAAHTAGNHTHTPFGPCLIGLPRTRSGSPLTSSIPLPVMLRAV